MKKKLIVFILTLGVFSIINTEMGIVGIMPLISEHFNVTITNAGLMVSLFALAVAIAGPTMPLLFSRMNRKKAMLMVLGMFTICNVIAAFAPNFTIALIARVLPAFFHPIYVSLALTVAGNSVDEKDAPKAVSKVLIGVSAGMVLGVPIVSFIANATSLMVGMLFFAAVNLLAFIATIFFIPTQPVSEQLTYGEQVRCLKLPITWISIFGVVCLNGAIFGVYSYFAEFLGNVTQMSENVVSVILLVYGLANIVGNMIGGKALSTKPIRFIQLFPCLLAVVYIVLFIVGEFSIPMALMTFLWGVLAGAAGNINQYWITSAVADAPEFGNGLFLAATNLGTTIGTTICGWLIASMGIHHVILGGMILLAGSMMLIMWRVKKAATLPQQKLADITVSE